MQDETLDGLLDLVSTEDLIGVLTNRCDAIVVVMQKKHADVTDGDAPIKVFAGLETVAENRHSRALCRAAIDLLYHEQVKRSTGK